MPAIAQVHGAHHQVFIDAEERAISNYISDNYRVSGRLFTDTSFIEIATMAFLEKYRNKEALSEFQYSPGSNSDFKEQNHFSSRRAHMRYRPSVTEDEKMHWITTLFLLLRLVQNHQRIVNVDESCWRVHSYGLPTWTPTGAQNIRLCLEGNETESFTVVAATHHSESSWTTADAVH
jgi:hypothetical protein